METFCVLTGIRLEVSKMHCPHCSVELFVGTTDYTINRKGYHLIIDDVLVLVCELCHHPLFIEEVVELVQEMTRTIDARRRELDTIPMAA